MRHCGGGRWHLQRPTRSDGDRDKQLDAITALEDIKAAANEYHQTSSQRLEGLKKDVSNIVKSLESSSLEPIGAAEAGSHSMGALLDLVRRLHSHLVGHSLHARVLKQLWFSSMYSRQDNLGPPADGTFDWILAEEAITEDPDQVHPRSPVRECARSSLISWLDTDASIFHLSGKAGSGKSTLMKLISRHPTTEKKLDNWAGHKTLVKARFYFWKEDNLRMPLEGFYRSILFETLLQYPDLTEILFPGQWRELVNDLGKTREPDESLFRYSAVAEAFERLRSLPESPSHKFCYLIDGLDEYKDSRLDHEVLAQKLRAWAQMPGVKILTSARPHIEFLDTFDTPGNVVVDLSQLNRPDIYTFTSKALERPPSEPPVPASDDEGWGSQGGLASEISRRSEGVFLWAVLVLRLLKTSMRFRDPPEVQRAKLASIPDDLNSLYQELLASIDPIDVPQSNRLLLVAANNPSPGALDAIEFKWVEDLHRDPTFARRHDFRTSVPERALEESIETLRLQLDLLTKGLLQVTLKATYKDGNRYVIEFFHKSVRDFLSTDEKQRDLRRDFPGFMGDETYVLLPFFALAFKQLNSTTNVPLNSNTNIPLNSTTNVPLRGYCTYLLDFISEHAGISVDTLCTIEHVMRGLPWSEAVPSYVRFVNFAAYCGYHEYVMEQLHRNLDDLVGTSTHDLLLSSLQSNNPNLALSISLVETGYSATDMVLACRGATKGTRFPVWMVAAFNLLKRIIPSGWTHVHQDTRCVELLNFLLQEGAPSNASIVIMGNQPTGTGKEQYVITMAAFTSQYEPFRRASIALWHEESVPSRERRRRAAGVFPTSPAEHHCDDRGRRQFSVRMMMHPLDYRLWSIEHDGLVIMEEHKDTGWWGCYP